MTSAFLASGGFKEERGANLLDGGVPFYDIYETSDGRHMSVGSLEPQFFDTLVTLLGVKDTAPGQHEPERYDEMRKVFTEVFRTKTQAEWVSSSSRAPTRASPGSSRSARPPSTRT